MRKKSATVLRIILFLVTAVPILGSTAQAQTGKPNILIIWGDDIGQFNISAYNMGMMGYRTPNIDRIAKEGALFTDWYGQQSCTAGRAAFITGQSPSAPASPRSVCPGARGHEEGRPDHRHAAQGAGLHDRPVRQEPPRRPRRDAADRARVRRVLRQPLSPECRGGAGESRLSEGPGVQEEVRAARRHPQLRRRPHRGHRPADAQADGDDRRGGHRQSARLHDARQAGE